MPNLLAALAVLLIAGLPGTCRAGDLGTSFRDDFKVLNRGLWMASDGWSNGDWTNCTWSKRALSVDRGRLHLSFLRHPRDADTYLCGEIQSRAAYGYGTFEAMMKTGSGSGLNAAFFTYTGPSQNRPHHEIDLEILLRDTTEVAFNAYVDGTPGGGRTVPLDRAADTAFVHYAFTWRPDGIAWFVNGRKVHQTAPGDAIPTEPQKIFASLWGTKTLTDWMGPFDASAVPQSSQIDWIAYTRLGEPCHFPASILCAVDR